MSKPEEFTLDRVIEYMRTYCDIKEGRKQEKRQTNDIHQIKYSDNGDSRKSISNCMYCGSSHERLKCPAFKKKCSKCGKLNHFARVCRSGGNDNGGFKNKLHSLESMNPTNYAISEEEDDAYIAFLGNCEYSKYLLPTGEYFV